MDRIKTFKWYFIIFTAFFLVCSILTYAVMIRPNKALKYEITFDSPNLIITETEDRYTYGHINGEIKNNTENRINQKYLKFEFYNERGTYLGTKYKELKYFTVNETIKFNIEYDYENSDSVKISLIDEQSKKVQKKSIYSEPDIKIALIVSLILGLSVALPLIGML